MISSSRITSPDSPPRWVRRVAAAMLPLLVLCMLGVPLPTFHPKLVDERFPCENRPCGCNTAAQCWEKCCCFTDQQKLDWAEENGVKPPTFLVKRFATAKSKSESVAVSKAKSKCSSCPSCKKTATTAAIKPSSCCQPNDVSTKKSCCSVKADSPKSKNAKSATSDQPKSRYKVVLLDSAFKCQGIHQALLLFKSALTPGCEQLDFPNPLLVGKVEPFDLRATSIDLDLDGPVPRLSVWAFL